MFGEALGQSRRAVSLLGGCTPESPASIGSGHGGGVWGS